jgi:Restriction endonuclease fold toxin 5
VKAAVRGGTLAWRRAHLAPGWLTKNEHMRSYSRRYQEFNGARPGEAFRVERRGERADFDSFENGVLVDSKGRYDGFFKDGSPQGFWAAGREKMLEQAARQVRVANGVPIEWRFAQNGAAYRYFKRELRARGLPISVRHVPMPD